MTGAKDQAFKTTTTFKDANTMVYEMWAPGPNGEFFKTLGATMPRTLELWRELLATRLTE